MRKQILWYLLLLVPLAPVILGLGTFIYPRYSEYSDLTISHLPGAVFILNTIRTEGFIPLWSPLLMGGYPFSADPLAGLWYPPNWIAILLPAPYGFNLAAGLHILWAGLGMADFLAKIGLRRPAAIFGGIAFAAMPKIFAHLALGHVSMVYSLAWYPWLLLAEEKRTSPGTKPLDRLLPGCVLGMIGLADPRSLVYAGLLYFLYWLWHSFLKKSGPPRIKVLAAKTAGFAGQTLIGVGIAAALLLPLVQFNAFSTRADLTPDEALVYSLPFHKLLSFFIPEFGGYAEWITYSGGAVIFLLFLVIAAPGLRRRAAFWLALFFLAVILALGSNIKVLEWMTALPGGNLLRVPARMIFLAGLAAAVAASHGFDELLGGFRKPRFDPIFWMVGAAAFFLVLIIGSAAMKIPAGAHQIWGCAGLIVAIILIGLAERGKLSAALVAATFPVFLLIDLVGVNLQSVQYRPASEVFAEGKDIIGFLQQDKGIYRVYSPSYSLPQLASSQAGIEMASTVHPLQLKEYASQLYAASGVKESGYSVALPPLDEPDLAQSNWNSVLDASLLGAMNVKYILAPYLIENSALEEIWRNGEVRIYQNALWLPRARLEGNGSGVGEIRIEKAAPGSVKILAEGPGRLVWAEVYYPGWQAWIDGTKVETLRVANLWLGVDLPSGRHQVEFDYRPGLQYAGFAISICAWAGVFFFGCYRRRK